MLCLVECFAAGRLSAWAGAVNWCFTVGMDAFVCLLGALLVVGNLFHELLQFHKRSFRAIGVIRGLFGGLFPLRLFQVFSDVFADDVKFKVDHRSYFEFVEVGDIVGVGDDRYLERAVF